MGFFYSSPHLVYCIGLSPQISIKRVMFMVVKCENVEIFQK